jgi:hypothetical protein
VKLLDQFIAQTGKKPTEWTSQDIQKYLHYVKTQVTAGSLHKTYLSMHTQPGANEKRP